MVDPASLRSSSSLLTEALEAGRKRMQTQGVAAADISSTFEQLAQQMLGQTERSNAVASADAIGGGLRDGIGAVNAEVRAVEGLDEAVMTGKVQDFHEVAAQIKRADLALSYAMEIRNRLIDAYRETMRMSV